jgi:hypothetical protein
MIGLGGGLLASSRKKRLERLRKELERAILGVDHG